MGDSYFKTNLVFYRINSVFSLNWLGFFSEPTQLFCRTDSIAIYITNSVAWTRCTPTASFSFLQKDTYCSFTHARLLKMWLHQDTACSSTSHALLLLLPLLLLPPPLLLLLLPLLLLLLLLLPPRLLLLLMMISAYMWCATYYVDVITFSVVFHGNYMYFYRKL